MIIRVYIYIHTDIYIYVYIHLISTTWFVRGHASAYTPIPQRKSQVEEAQKAAVQKAQQEAARCRFCGGLWEKILEMIGKNMGKSWWKYGKIIEKMELLMGKSSRNGGS